MSHNRCDKDLWRIHRPKTAIRPGTFRSMCHRMLSKQVMHGIAKWLFNASRGEFHFLVLGDRNRPSQHELCFWLKGRNSILLNHSLCGFAFYFCNGFSRSFLVFHSFTHVKSIIQPTEEMILARLTHSLNTIVLPAGWNLSAIFFPKKSWISNKKNDIFLWLSTQNVKR